MPVRRRAFVHLQQGLVALSAAGFTIRAQRQEGEDADRDTTDQVKRYCYAEIEAFRSILTSGNFAADLRAATRELKELLGNSANSGSRGDRGTRRDDALLFRRDLGGEWFLFAARNPLPLTRLGPLSRDYLLLSATVRYFLSRLAYLNVASAESQTIGFWCDQHDRLSETLADIQTQFEAVQNGLHVDP